MPFNKVTSYHHTLGILDSEVGLVLKTHQAGREDVKKADDEGRYVLKAGALYTDKETSEIGVVYEDYDLTDYPEFPISVVMQGRLRKDRVSSEAQGKATDFAKQGLYLV